MSAASTALQRALFQALSHDGELLTALGSAKIYDRVPERVSAPYIVLGRSTVSDWSTSTEDGETIVFFVHVWSRANSRHECNSLQDLVRRVLTDDVALTNPHELVALRFQLAETRRDHETDHVHAVMRFTATIEPSG
ncbi:MAG: DUF3168 domain-containing protein [Ahrensia sp.]|nr:DUF3168 domain-containing protein [Ahrensia sp.]